MTSNKTGSRDLVIRKLERSLQDAQEVIGKFKSKLDSDPVEAMKWSADAFRAAGKLKVYSYCLRILAENTELTVVAFVAELRKEVISSAVYPSFSTSVPSNLVDTFENAAKAEVCEWFENFS